MPCVGEMPGVSGQHGQDRAVKRWITTIYAEKRGVPFTYEPVLESDPQLLALGERIAMRGVPDGDVSATAGQNRHYLEQQLRLWRRWRFTTRPSRSRNRLRQIEQSDWRR